MGDFTQSAGETAHGGASAQRYEKMKSKAESNYKTVKNLLDEDTRSGEIFKLGLKGMLKLGEKLVGRSLSKHPFFKYHKQHLEALVSALNASDTHNNALRELDRALQSADAAAALANSLDTYTQRKQAEKFFYATQLDGRLRLNRERLANPNSPQVIEQLNETGLPGISIAIVSGLDLLAWRGRICDLYFGVLELFVMVDIEYRAAAAAMASFNGKMQKLQSSKKNIDYVAGKALEKKQQEEAIYQYSQRGGNAAEAVMDPTLYVKRQRDKVEEAIKVFATLCDAAMSNDAFDPDAMNRRIGSL